MVNLNVSDDIKSILNLDPSFGVSEDVLIEVTRIICSRYFTKFLFFVKYFFLVLTLIFFSLLAIRDIQIGDCFI